MPEYGVSAVSDYEVRHETPGIADYIRIRFEAGLSRKSEEAAAIGLKNGLFSVVAYCGEEPIGLGRIIGDGGCFFQVVDIAVVPDHQGKGVGDLIMRNLMDYIRANCPPTAYVSLIAVHGTFDFYRRYGFIATELPDATGMYVRMP
jgi:GNAT superfamily N-acetyltransferase